jgi:biotin carboxyl carrier protein
MRRYTIEVAGQHYVIDVDEITADRYRVVADGQELEVRLTGDEDLARSEIRPEIIPMRGGLPPAPAPTAAVHPVPDLAPPAAPTPAPGPISQEAGVLVAPMPGTVLTVDVAEGERVARGQQLLTLEAMKMKNAIRAPQDGVVLAVRVTSGQRVAHGDLLLRLGEA